mgnify:CR=1 FL=1
MKRSLVISVTVIALLIVGLVTAFAYYGASANAAVVNTKILPSVYLIFS